MVAEVAGIPVQIWQAGIAGSVVAAGWMVNGWSNRRDAERLRLIRQADALKALRAEISAFVRRLYTANMSETAPAKQPVPQVSSPDADPFGQQSAQGI